jgi:P22 coat protein - gene protein 5
VAQRLLTMTQITKGILPPLHANLVAAKGVDRQHSAEFAVSGAMIGNTLNIRLPNRYYVSDGPNLQAQDTQEQVVPLTINHQWQVSTNFTSADFTLSLDEFTRRILTPKAAALTGKIDWWIMLDAAMNAFNVVGTPGTVPGDGAAITGMGNASAPRIYLNSALYLDQNNVPADNKRRIIITPDAQAASVDGLKNILNDQHLVGEQYRKGVLGEAFGYEFAMDQNAYAIQPGIHGTGTPYVNGAGQTGTSLYTSGWPANTAVLMPGEVIQIAGVNSVNPENQQDNGRVANFCVGGFNLQYSNGQTSLLLSPVISDANGNATIPLASPQNGIVAIGSQIANGTVTTAPANGALITCFYPANTAATSTSYKQSIAMHHDAMTLATADLVLEPNLQLGARMVYDGISVRIIRQYTIGTDQIPCRIDVLGGIKTLRPELLVKITQ